MSKHKTSSSKALTPVDRLTTVQLGIATYDRCISVCGSPSCAMELQSTTRVIRLRSLLPAHGGTSNLFVLLASNDQ